MNPTSVYSIVCKISQSFFSDRNLVCISLYQKKKSLSYLPEYNPLFYIFQVRMVIDEDVGGFGFTNKNELINGKAAIIGFLLLIDFELLTGKGLLKGTGLLDFIYAISRAFSS